ncbi:MAG: tetratricopeptide repeat protein [Woeseiaceae bacterium]
MLKAIQKGWLTGVLALTLVVQPVSADENMSVAELLGAAEAAMTDGDYKAGVQGYLDTALASDSVETARQATIVATEFGFDQVAVQAAERWAVIAPASTEARQYRAYATVRGGDIKDAVAQFSALIESTDDVDAICDHAKEALDRDARPVDVSDVFKALAKKFDETPCVLRLAALTAVGVSEHDRAEKYLEALKDLDAFDNAARLIAITRLVRQEEADAAFTDETLYLDQNATIDERLELAFLNAQSDQGENALNMVSQLREEAPDNVDVLQGEGLLKLQAGDVAGAQTAFRELLISGEKTSDALFYLGRFAEGERRFDQATRMYSQVAHGDLVVAAQRRAATIIGQREGIEAGISHVEGFAKRHPRYGLALSLVTAAAYAEGDYFDQSLALYDDYLALRPSAEFAQLARADVLLQADRLDDAIEAFRSVVKRFPDSANAMNALGYTLADRTTKFREAERLIDKALKKEPDNAAIIDSKGWVLFRRGRFTEALEYLERAWDEFPDPEVAAHLGETLWRLGREDESRQLLQDAWQRFPNNDDLRDTIERLLDDGPTTRS